MQRTEENWLDGIALLCVIVLLPFYIGYIDSPFEIMLFYALAAGVALTVADRLIHACNGKRFRDMIVNAGVQALAVLIFGLIPFGLAIWLI